MKERMSRRDLLEAALALTGLGLSVPGMAPRAQGSVGELPQFQRVVAANRILAREGVVDAFGHVSVRDPRNRERYVMSHSRSPALVTLPDLLTFELDGSKVHPEDDRLPYGERMIHGAIYEARPEVNAVVHHHSYAVAPFSVSPVPLRPVVHAASVIGARIPVWDIRGDFGDTDMLVRTMDMGRALARVLADNTCLLIRGHGAVVVGTDVRRAVLSAVYLQVNAQLVSQALALGSEPRYLSPGEIELSSATQFSPLALDRAWEYFCNRAGVDPV